MPQSSLVARKNRHPRDYEGFVDFPGAALGKAADNVEPAALAGVASSVEAVSPNFTTVGQSTKHPAEGGRLQVVPLH